MSKIYLQEQWPWFIWMSGRANVYVYTKTERQKSAATPFWQYGSTKNTDSSHILCRTHTNSFLNGRSDYSEAFLWQCEARSSTSNSISTDWSRSAVRCSRLRLSRGWFEADLLFDEQADIHIIFIDFQERQVPCFPSEQVKKIRNAKQLEKFKL